MFFRRLCFLLTGLILFADNNHSFGQAAGRPEFFIYEDQSKELDASKALSLFKEGKFKQAETESLNIGFTRSVFWLIYPAEKEYPSGSRLLYIGDHHINRINFYQAVDSNVQQLFLTGDYYPFSQRPVNATGFYFPIQEKGIYIARIDKSNESLQLSFHLTTSSTALRTEGKNAIILSLLTGMIALMIIFGLYLFFMSRDNLYLLYIAYLSSGWLWVLANSGHGFQYIWPHLPWLASKARPVFSICTIILLMTFLIRYIGGLKYKIFERSIKRMNWVLAMSILVVLLLNEHGYQSKAWLYLQFGIPFFSLLYLVIALGILIAACVRGNKLAMFYLASILVLMTSGLLQVIFYSGGLDSHENFFSHYGMSVGYIVEAIILTAGLVFRFNQYRLEKETLLTEMNQRQVENTRIMMEVQEAERSQVANQLHDVAGSLLSAAKLNLTSLRENEWALNEKTRLQLKKTEEAVSQVSEMVRNLSHALSPVMLEQVGFKTALEKVVAILNASGKISIRLLVIGFDRYEAEWSQCYTALYSITYELLNNIVKHSCAAHVLIQVTEHADCFTLITEDDGKGIDADQTMDKQALGTAGIRSKIYYFGGSVAFDNNEPSGLIVTIEIPKNRS